MPIQGCIKDGRPGYKWGKNGKCYTYTPGDKTSRERAKRRARAQGAAARARGFHE